LTLDSDRGWIYYNHQQENYAILYNFYGFDLRGPIDSIV